MGAEGVSPCAQGPGAPCTLRRESMPGPTRAASPPPPPGTALAGPSPLQGAELGTQSGAVMPTAVRDETPKWRNELYFQSSTG